MTSIEVRTVFAATTLVLLLAGCTIHTRGSTETSGSAAMTTASSSKAKVAAPTASAPETASGVTIVEASCSPDASEQCNGLDDNCNGEIDEGCGYSGGDVQVTLAWNSDADLDMYIADPSGEVISHSHRRSASGGFLDHDARGQCRPRQDNNRIENAFWASNPPKGRYSIDVHYWGECNSGAGPTTATLSISVGGKVIGSYNYTLSPTQRITLASFDLP